MAGTYTVILTATNARGSNTLTRTGYITPTSVAAPVASFTGTPTTGTAPLTVTFADASTNTPTSWAWTFGDGGTSTLKSPQHTYTMGGTYSVTLTATNAGGSNTLTKTGYITVTSGTVPVASFSGTPTSGTAPLTVTFTDASTNTPTSWAWTFGDGGTSTLKSPQHTYTTAGTYSVTLTATNANGSNSKTMSNYITVTAASSPPVAAFSGTPVSGIAPLTVQFTDSSSNTPTSWAWTFGDGGTSTLKSPQHTYTTTGFYTVMLKVTNAQGSSQVIKRNYVKVQAVKVRQN